MYSNRWITGPLSTCWYYTPLEWKWGGTSEKGIINKVDAPVSWPPRQPQLWPRNARDLLQTGDGHTKTARELQEQKHIFSRTAISQEGSTSFLSHLALQCPRHGYASEALVQAACRRCGSHGTRRVTQHWRAPASAKWRKKKCRNGKGQNLGPLRRKSEQCKMMLSHRNNYRSCFLFSACKMIENISQNNIEHPVLVLVLQEESGFCLLPGYHCLIKRTTG